MRYGPPSGAEAAAGRYQMSQNARTCIHLSIELAFTSASTASKTCPSHHLPHCYIAERLVGTSGNLILSDVCVVAKRWRWPQRCCERVAFIHQPQKRFRHLDVALVTKTLDYFRSYYVSMPGTGFNLKILPALARVTSSVARRKLGKKLKLSGPSLLSRFRFATFSAVQPCR